MKDLFVDVEKATPDGGAWCSVAKANALVAMVVALRPRLVVELGIWQGGSAIPLALALHYNFVHHNVHGQLVAIDAWSTEASISGQEDAHLKWWSEKGADGHERAYRTFMTRLDKHGITSERCVVRRERTDEAVVPSLIDILHHDANHGPQVVSDIERWTPSIRVGGLLIIDDLNWPGGHVARARDRSLELGFVELYPIGTGCVMQRVRVPPF